jgi:hypothetical protein
MTNKTLEQRITRLEKLLLNESVKLDSLTVFAYSTSRSDREQYILDQLSALKNGSRLLGIGNRGYTFVVTKIDDDQYKYQYGANLSDVHSPKMIIDDILRDRTSFFELPRSIKLVKNNAIHYDDDLVVVYRNDKEIYSGEEDDEPMKRERWRFSPDFGLYWITDYSSRSLYTKTKLTQD